MGSHGNSGPLGLTTDSRPVHLLPGINEAAPADELAAGPAAAAPIFDDRFGCMLHIVQLAVIGGDGRSSRSFLKCFANRSAREFDAVSDAWRATSSAHLGPGIHQGYISVATKILLLNKFGLVLAKSGLSSEAISGTANHGIVSQERNRSMTRVTR